MRPQLYHCKTLLADLLGYRFRQRRIQAKDQHHTSPKFALNEGDGSDLSTDACGIIRGKMLAD
ncbi:MAG: hypothetical protein BWK77_04205 [Verrucomicrobia bacterium A1]|nr:MAG: hypothetical protein BWK77_04205 [Verrucomicrobia bacterium A1]